MTSPIIQLPFLRPDPLHEEQGALGGIGQALGALGQALEKRREFALQQQLRQDQAESLAGLRKAEEGKLTLEQKKLQADLVYREQAQAARNAALAGVTDESTRQKLSVLMQLGDLPEKQRGIVAEQLFPVHGIEPRLAASFAKLASTGSATVGQIYRILGQDPTDLGDPADPKSIYNFKFPKTRTASEELQGERLKITKLQAALNATNKSIEQIDKKAKQHDTELRQERSTSTGKQLTLEEVQTRENFFLHQRGLYIGATAPHYPTLLKQRDALTKQLQDASGYTKALERILGQQGQQQSQAPTDDLEAYIAAQLQGGGSSAPPPR